MNTSGVPCTIKRFGIEKVAQIDHVEDKKKMFATEMEATQSKHKEMIEGILEKLD